MSGLEQLDSVASNRMGGVKFDNDRYPGADKGAEAPFFFVEGVTRDPSVSLLERLLDSCLKIEHLLVAALGDLHATDLDIGHESSSASGSESLPPSVDFSVGEGRSRPYAPASLPPDGDGAGDAGGGLGVASSSRAKAAVRYRMLDQVAVGVIVDALNRSPVALSDAPAFVEALEAFRGVRAAVVTPVEEVEP